jgi:hypothetical protein
MYCGCATGPVELESAPTSLARQPLWSTAFGPVPLKGRQMGGQSFMRFDVVARPAWNVAPEQWLWAWPIGITFETAIAIIDRSRWRPVRFGLADYVVERGAFENG